MPKVLVPHSWSHNMGDAAMLITISEIIRRASPGSSVTALASHPQFTKEKCPGIKADVEGWPWPVPRGKPSPAELVGYPLVFFANMFSAAAYRLFRKKVFIFNSRFSGPLAKFFECDVVVSPGGDFIGPNYFFMTTFGEFMMARILGKKLVILAQTMGPFRGMLNGTLAGFVLKLPHLIIVRESRTARDLEKIGVRGAVVTADVAFLFDGKSGVQSASRVLRNKLGGGRARVVMCPKKISRGRDQYATGMRKLARKIAGMGCDIAFIPTDRYDLDFHSEIASGLDFEHRLVSEIRSPQEIAGLIAESDFVVSSRMHAIILGTLSSTPFVAIGDSFKFSEILDPLCSGCTESAAELNDEAIERIAQKIGERESLRKRIKENFPSVRATAMRNQEILAEKFAEWGL